jgi:hypothetical protein
LGAAGKAYEIVATISDAAHGGQTVLNSSHLAYNARM